MPRLTIEEASDTWLSAMRNILAPGPGACRTCRTFIDHAYARCFRCKSSPAHLDVVVPITYSLAGGQVHLALRNYKDGFGEDLRRYATVRLLAILWRFLDTHEGCVARAAGVSEFDVVSNVPSSAPERDARTSSLRHIVQACGPIAGRYRPIVEVSTASPSTHAFDSARYRATGELPAGSNVLLVDDTWTTGAHSQSAAYALKHAGARTVALVVIGRHIDPDWQIGSRTHGQLFDALPTCFRWSVCAAE